MSYGPQGRITLDSYQTISLKIIHEAYTIEQSNKEHGHTHAQYNA